MAKIILTPPRESPPVQRPAPPPLAAQVCQMKKIGLSALSNMFYVYFCFRWHVNTQFCHWQLLLVSQVHNSVCGEVYLRPHTHPLTLHPVHADHLYSCGLQMWALWSLIADRLQMNLRGRMSRCAAWPQALWDCSAGGGGGCAGGGILATGNYCEPMRCRWCELWESKGLWCVCVAQKQTGEKLPVSLPSSLSTQAATGYY